jgi:site-specific recombinase XerD
MQDLLTRFINYLRIERSCSLNTLKDYKLELDKFLLFIQSNNVNNIASVDTSAVREYLYHIKVARNLSNISLHKKIAVIKSFFNFLESEDLIENNPTKKIKLPRKEKRIAKAISEVEFKRLLSCIEFCPLRQKKHIIRNTLIFSILYYCGLRRGELLALNWDDINLGKNLLFVRLSKNKTGRIIPLHPKVKELLDLYLTQRLPLKNKSLFIGSEGKRIALSSFTFMLNYYFKISGLKDKGYTTHSLRHSFATRLIENNVNIFLVQRLLGHKSLDATKVYVHFDGEQYKRAIEVL